MNVKEIRKVLCQFVALNPELAEIELGADTEEGEEPDAAEIEGLGDDLANTVERIFENSWSGRPYKEVPGYEVDREEQFGGEGLGDKYWYIVSIKDLASGETSYAHFNGYYASHYGHEFDDPSQFTVVVARKVEVTKWFKEGSDEPVGD